MRPTLQDVIERAWNETANLPDGEKPKIHDNQLALELARYYEQDGHTAQQREDALKADTWTLLCAYSFALRGIPRYWKPEPIRTKKAYHYMALSMRSILRDLIILAFDMGLRLPQDTLKEYERHELWVQDFKPDVAQLYGEISGDEASTPTTPQPSPEDGAESQQPTKDFSKKEPKQKGRPQKEFDEFFIMAENVDKIKPIIRKLISGKIGRDAARIIVACCKGGWITEPTAVSIEREFGISQSGLKEPLRCHFKESHFPSFGNPKFSPFTDEELTPIINSIKKSLQP